MKSEREDILDLAEEETATDPLVDVKSRGRDSAVRGFKMSLKGGHRAKNRTWRHHASRAVHGRTYFTPDSRGQREQPRGHPSPRGCLGVGQVDDDKTVVSSFALLLMRFRALEFD